MDECSVFLLRQKFFEEIYPKAALTLQHIG